MDSDGARLIERMAACLPCYSCGAGRSWQLWPGDFDEDAQPILTAPTPALAECLIPPSMADPFRQTSRGSDTGRAWDSSEGTRIQVLTVVGLQSVHVLCVYYGALQAVSSLLFVGIQEHLRLDE